jgi:hypothetical protein
MWQRDMIGRVSESDIAHLHAPTLTNHETTRILGISIWIVGV